MAGAPPLYGICAEMRARADVQQLGLHVVAGAEAGGAIVSDPGLALSARHQVGELLRENGRR